MLPVAVTFNDKGDAVVEKRPSFSFGFHVARPESRGGIRLRSADPDAKPLIDHRLQSAASDVAKLVKALKIVEGICRTRPLSDTVTGTLRPDPPPETDEQWEAYFRRWGGLGYQPTGTRRMGAIGSHPAVPAPQPSFQRLSRTR